MLSLYIVFLGITRQDKLILSAFFLETKRKAVFLKLQVHSIPFRVYMYEAVYPQYEMLCVNPAALSWLKHLILRSYNLS